MHSLPVEHVSPDHTVTIDPPHRSHESDGAKGGKLFLGRAVNVAEVPKRVVESYARDCSYKTLCTIAISVSAGAVVGLLVGGIVFLAMSVEDVDGVYVCDNHSSNCHPKQKFVYSADLMGKCLGGGGVCGAGLGYIVGRRLAASQVTP